MLTNRRQRGPAAAHRVRGGDVHGPLVGAVLAGRDPEGDLPQPRVLLAGGARRLGAARPRAVLRCVRRWGVPLRGVPKERGRVAAQAGAALGPGGTASTQQRGAAQRSMPAVSSAPGGRRSARCGATHGPSKPLASLPELCRSRSSAPGGCQSPWCRARCAPPRRGRCRRPARRGGGARGGGRVGAGGSGWQPRAPASTWRCPSRQPAMHSRLVEPAVRGSQDGRVALAALPRPAPPRPKEAALVGAVSGGAP